MDLAFSPQATGVVCIRGKLLVLIWGYYIYTIYLELPLYLILILLVRSFYLAPAICTLLGESVRYF